MVSTRSHDRALQNGDLESHKRKPEQDDGSQPRPKRRKGTEEVVPVVVENVRPRRTIQEANRTVQVPPQFDGAADSLGEKSSNPPEKQASRPEAKAETRSLLQSRERGPSMERERPPADIASPKTSTKDNPIGYKAPTATDNKVSAPVGGLDGVDQREMDGDDTSDDDVPEEATAAAGDDKVGAAFQQAAESKAREEEARRAKRREHQQRMKSQAKRPRQTQGKDSGKKPRSKAPLPALLPDEILNAEPSAPIVPLPQSRSTAPLKANKKLLLDKIEKPPKDLVRGKTRIRVSADERAILPPKSSGKGKELREKWLMGQRGSKPAMWVSRQTSSKSFVSRSM
ncbi:MAG: hypothetical protein OHK93_008186 [Ramalina farinacea]|uniref:Uncharacterized protein n=1 Tax=Ramalina farinacea TaxID=258253 RepID=A0AA43TV29_9LECA|nr:hypothetical protein [Ramalina farinacea]